MFLYVYICLEVLTQTVHLNELRLIFGKGIPPPWAHTHTINVVHLT